MTARWRFSRRRHFFFQRADFCYCFLILLPGMVWFVWFDSCTRRPFRKTMLQRYAEAKQEYFSKNHWTEFFGPTSLLQIGLCLVSRGTIWRSCCSLQFGGILVLFIVIRKLKKKSILSVNDLDTQQWIALTEEELAKLIKKQPAMPVIHPVRYPHVSKITIQWGLH